MQFFLTREKSKDEIRCVPAVDAHVEDELTAPKPFSKLPKRIDRNQPVT